MRNFLTAASLAGLTFLAACSSTTPYGPAIDSRYGFSEQRLESNRWTVSFSGNSLTDLQTVERYLLYRSAELTRNQGADYFIMVNRKVDEDRRFQSSGFNRHPFHPAFSYNYYHPRLGWRSVYDPFYDDITMREVTRYEAMAEIVLGSGPKPPGNVHAYNAQDVLINLSGQVQRRSPVM